jgi:hypothetical protein
MLFDVFVKAQNALGNLVLFGASLLLLAIGMVPLGIMLRRHLRGRRMTGTVTGVRAEKSKSGREIYFATFDYLQEGVKKSAESVSAMGDLTRILPGTTHPILVSADNPEKCNMGSPGFLIAGLIFLIPGVLFCIQSLKSFEGGLVTLTCPPIFDPR